MATMVKSMALEGIEGFEVEIEAVTLRGQQQMISIIGLGDQAVRESGERIQAAMESYGYDIPKDKVLLSLAPGDRRKRGSHYDLGMIIALLAETEQIAAKDLERHLFIGELSLDGRLRPCKGLLPMVTAAKQLGCRSVIIPSVNQNEAKKIRGIEIHAMSSLKQVVQFLEGRKITSELPQVKSKDTKETRSIPDFSEVRGHEELIDAVVLAAAGGHNLLMIGEPGCGKSMIAERIPGILPMMSEEESLEVTKIHSIAGLLSNREGLVTHRPFRSPHHNVSLNALIGGGAFAQPGEVSLAHGGILFLDELAEFSRSTLDALRQPLENKKVTISRVNGTNTYPASFMFVAAMNPCPCGYYPSGKCRCTDYEIQHYRAKISGPILERIDIQKWVHPINYFDLTKQKAGYSSEELRKQVERARKIQEKNLDTAKRIYDNCLNHDILLLTIYDQPYPQALRAIPELPVLLYYKGKLKSDIRGMGIVGADVCYPSEHRGLIAAWSKELYVIGAGRNSGTRYTLDYYNKYHQKKGVILEREQ